MPQTEPVHRFLPSDEVLADTVRSARLAARLDACELAGRAGVDPGLVAVIESARGLCAADLPGVLALLEALGIHATALPPVRRPEPTEPADLDEVLRRHAD